ncbi:hypothetical protein ANCDUO_18664 [Ancylostoma duodenale]|uniref:Uncharacterized protein n=1 Tax=Ancylostoma duodenale TaxID=51022 RepID=A0A0C2G2H1_9BILA|nr:hypothetical protein ANCDUO_18664 [Ancylostoma duodenale]
MKVLTIFLLFALLVIYANAQMTDELRAEEEFAPIRVRRQWGGWGWGYGRPMDMDIHGAGHGEVACGEADGDPRPECGDKISCQ